MTLLDQEKYLVYLFTYLLSLLPLPRPKCKPSGQGFYPVFTFFFPLSAWQTEVLDTSLMDGR